MRTFSYDGKAAKIYAGGVVLKSGRSITLDASDAVAAQLVAAGAVEVVADSTLPEPVAAVDSTVAEPEPPTPRRSTRRGWKG